MSLTRGPKIITNGLVLCLDAGSPKSYPGSGTIWFDRSGRNNNGTLTNGPTFTSANGGALVFDGSNDYVTATVANGLGAGNFTLEFYYYKTADSGMVFNSRSGGTGGDGIDISHALSTTRAGTVIFSATTVNTNVWNHVAIIREGTTMTRYLNGVSNATFTDSSDFSSANFFIGGNTNGNVGYLTGRISIFRLYNKALSTSEREQNFNFQRARFGI